jgi:3-deoxy-7-phosphoheptulonate synthase
MIDCSHANSAKQHRRQIDVAADLAAQIAGGERRIIGVMLESHLHEGRQELRPGRSLAAGVSITDACIGWADTEPLLRSLAHAVQRRRSR